MVSGNTYSGDALEAALKEGTVADPTTVWTGMVKRSDKGGYVSFARFGCEAWVDVPIDMIEHAQSLGVRACRDHSHPVMAVRFKVPKDTEGKTFLALLAQTGSSPVFRAGYQTSPSYPSLRVPIAMGSRGGFGSFGNFGRVGGFAGHPDTPTDPGCEWILSSCGPGKGVPPWWPCWEWCCFDSWGNVTCTDSP